LIYYVHNFNQTEFIISEWEEDLTVNYKVLFELLLAANELKMESVVNMAAGILGDMIKGKSPVEIRRMFEIGCGGDKGDEMGGAGDGGCELSFW
jgi:Skp1 family, dimerisation domain